MEQKKRFPVINGNVTANGTTMSANRFIEFMYESGWATRWENSVNGQIYIVVTENLKSYGNKTNFD